MKRLAGLCLLAALVALPGIAIASPPDALSALRHLAAHGLVAGYDGSFTPSPPAQALLAARAIARVEAGGVTPADVADAQRLVDAMPSQLDALGVRVTNVRNEITSMEKRAVKDSAFAGVTVSIEDASTAASVRLSGVAAGPLRAEISGIAFSVMAAYMHVLVPRPEAIGGRPIVLAKSASGLRDDGLIRFGNARFSPAGHSPITLAFFGMTPAANALQAVDVIRPAVEGGAAVARFAPFASPSTPSPLDTPGLQDASVAGIAFRVRAVQPASAAARAGALATYAQVPPSAAFRIHALPEMAPQLPTAPAFGAQFAAPAVFASAAPGDFAVAPPSGTGSAFYNALVPNSGGMEVRLSAPVRLGGIAFRGNLGAAHLQEVSPNAFGTMPSLPATTNRVTAGTTFDVRAFSRRVSLELNSSYEKLSRDDRSPLAYTQYTPPVVNAPASSFVPPDIGAPDYVNPNYLNVTHRTINASAAVPITHALSLNLRYDTQFYTGSYSTLIQNVDERKDSYLGNLTYQIPRSSTAIVFSAKQYRYRDAFVPAFNVTQNRADLNFTVKF